jgi:S1-C subfamily serine protease
VRYALLLLGGAIAVAGCGGTKEAAPTTVAATTTAAAKQVVKTVTVTVTVPVPVPVPSGRTSTADLVARVLPSVVNVRTVDQGGGKGEGSGVVIDGDGIIVTNNHVVADARSVTIVFNDGVHNRPARAEVIGTSPEHDLAIVRVAVGNLKPLPFGRSSALRLGDGVLAIGFPLGFGGPTVTQGIVSGLDRTVTPDNGPPLQNLLQTDAAINPGNSGGALVDFAGRLVGINTAAAEGKTAENVGFSIGIDAAKVVIQEIRGKPASERAWIGASFDSVGSAADAAQLGLPPDVRGAVVVAVFGGGPAARAGVREGDVVVAANGTPIGGTADFTKVLSKLDAGSSVTLDVVDRVGPRRVTVAITKRPKGASG